MTGSTTGIISLMNAARAGAHVYSHTHTCTHTQSVLEETAGHAKLSIPRTRLCYSAVMRNYHSNAHVLFLRTWCQSSVSADRHTLPDGQEATPSWGVSSATFGGTPLKQSFLSQPIVIYSQGSRAWIFLFVSGHQRSQHRCRLTYSCLQGAVRGNKP